jgi:1,6-anhydro-N-acetylmuramate kinase
VLATVGLAACSGSSPAAAPTTAAPTPISQGATVLAAYQSMWSDLVTAAQTSDYQSPLLAQHATGAALTLLVQGLARDELNGIVTRGKTVRHPQVASLTPAGSPTQATVTDCFADTHWLEYTSTGALAKNTSGGRRVTTAHLLRKAGTWKVSDLTIEATGTC